MSGPRPSARARRARSSEALASSQGRAGPATASRPSSVRSSAPRRASVRVGHQQQPALLDVGRLGHRDRRAGQRDQHRTHLRVGDQHRGQGRGRLPLGAAGGRRPRSRRGRRSAAGGPAAPAAAGAPGPWWPARRCARRRWRRTARRCRRRPARRSRPASPRPSLPAPRSSTSPATRPGPRSGRPRAARRWCVRCAPRPGPAGRRPPPRGRWACAGRRRADRRPGRGSRPAPAAPRCGCSRPSSRSARRRSCGTSAMMAATTRVGHRGQVGAHLGDRLCGQLEAVAGDVRGEPSRHVVRSEQ